jgi:alginate O-acetyltransferase complex protein AlgI
MIITSYGFLLLFFPLTLLLYWGVFRSSRQKLWFLCFASYLFYALGGWLFTALLLGLSLTTFWLARIKRAGWGIALNLLALAFFKYWNFGAENINNLTSSLGVSAFAPLLGFALPLGISFYVFKHIGYLIDVRSGKYRATSDFLLFTTYSAFFPQISAGPISQFDDTGGQLAQLPRRLSSEAVYDGLMHISIGLIKKLMLADALSESLRTGLYAPGDAGAGMLWAWLSVILYALQLYLDFSAYTDLALGVAYLLGVKLPPNFNNPYLATNPGQFWQRWHMSLSNWFRLYLFSPLSRSLLKRWGTSRQAQAQYTANLVTMGLVGLWHGAGWGFILWGIYHGLLLNLYAWAGRRKLRLDSHLLLIILVLIGWALFLSPDLAFAGRLLAQMFGAGGIGSPEALSALYTPYTLFIAAAAIFITLSGLVEAANLPRIQNPAAAFLLGVLALVAILQLGEAATFIYVQF